MCFGLGLRFGKSCAFIVERRCIAETIGKCGELKEIGLRRPISAAPTLNAHKPTYLEFEYCGADAIAIVHFEF